MPKHFFLSKTCFKNLVLTMSTRYFRKVLKLIDGTCPMETTKTGARTASAVISSRSSTPQGSSGLSEIQRRSLLVTPPRRPINRSELDQTEKETEEFESGHDNPANSAEKSSVPLVRFNDESEGEDYSFYSDDSMDQETSGSRNLSKLNPAFPDLGFRLKYR